MSHAAMHTTKSRSKPYARGYRTGLVGSRQQERPRGGEAHAYPFIVDEILEGLEHDEFEPYFQPKVDIQTFQVTGTEALARWHHPQFGLVRPHVFLEPLERAGRGALLTRCILTKAARFCRTLDHAGRADTVAVNISLRSLADPRFADDVLAAVRSEGLDPRRIVLDVVYSGRTPDLDSAIDNLVRLHAEGFALSIDPHGDGYAAMQRLTVIPFAELKIDQFFVTYAGNHDAAREILASSIAMARRLGIQSVAEGVESRGTWNLLSELGCDFAQGHYFAEPMASGHYMEWLRLWPEARFSYSA